MRFELKKQVLRSGTLIVTYAIALLFFVIVFRTSGKMTTTNDLSHYLGSYSSQEELIQMAKENQNAYDANKEDYIALGWDLEPLLTRIKVFDYAIENEIESDKAGMYFNLEPFTAKDSTSVMETMNFLILIIGIIVSAILSISLFATDFSHGQSRFLYSANQRSVVIKDKVKVYFLIIVAVSLAIEVFSTVMQLIFATKVPLVIFVYNGEVFSLRFWVVFLIEIVSWFIQLFPFTLAFLAFAMLTRNELLSGVLDIGFFVLIVNVLERVEQGKIRFIGTSPFLTVMCGNSTIAEWLFANLIEFVVVAVLFAVAIVRFRKAQFR